MTQQNKPTKIEIVYSDRIDYCGACKKDHGYECPLDVKENKPWWIEEFNQLYRNRILNGEPIPSYEMTNAFLDNVMAFVSRIEQETIKRCAEKVIRFKKPHMHDIFARVVDQMATEVMDLLETNEEKR